MSNEDVSIFDEINEELKNEQLFKFFKAHQNAILAVIAVVVIGILAHSSWHSRKNKQMEDISIVLLQTLQAPSQKDALMISKLLDNAPAELRPILSIMKSGNKVLRNEDTEQSLQALLDLSQKHGVDIIWKDLAVLIYVSYTPHAPDNLIKLLQPLTADDRPFRFSALEFIGMMCENSGKHEEALKHLDKIISSKEAPNTLKERVTMLAGRIREKLGK